MISHLADDFIRCFENLPDRIKQKARKNYGLWQRNPSHPGLHFKKVHEHKPVYSVRVGIGWRAVGIMEGNTMTWFWIGSHSDYEKLLSRLKCQKLIVCRTGSPFPPRAKCQCEKSMPVAAVWLYYASCKFQYIKSGFVIDSAFPSAA